MKTVAKYNTMKGISTGITVVTPIATLLACGDFIVERSDRTISAAGVICLIVVLLCCKDKLAENWKVPSAFILATVVFIIALLIEHILIPIKIVCISTMVATGVDELTFKRVYKTIEKLLPKEAEAYKHFGFLCCKTTTLIKEEIAPNNDAH